MKKAISMILVFVMMVSVILTSNVQEAIAADKYITVNDFGKALLDELGIAVMSDDATNIIQLQGVGVIKEGEFADYNSYLTRGDALMMLSRADDYVNKTVISEEQVQMVIEKRISDINKAKKAKREDIAKGYIKGFIKGYSNGNYITNRTMKINSKITRAGALSCIKMIKDTSLRAKISPDGQLIRTTKLPKNADKFDYILESFPNKFYERKFEFMAYNEFKKGETADRWVYPIEMKNIMYKTWYEEWPMSIEMDKYLYDWTKLAEDYIHTIFNVDYRTINRDWAESVAKFYPKANVNFADIIETYYTPRMKENKVVVETAHVVGEPSTFYLDGDYIIRVYVKYRISAKDINVNHQRLVYTGMYSKFDNLVNGKWREGIFDVRMIAGNAFNGDGALFVVVPTTNLVDTYVK